MGEKSKLSKISKKGMEKKDYSWITKNWLESTLSVGYKEGSFVSSKSLYERFLLYARLKKEEISLKKFVSLLKKVLPEGCKIKQKKLEGVPVRGVTNLEVTDNPLPEAKEGKVTDNPLPERNLFEDARVRLLFEDIHKHYVGTRRNDGSYRTAADVEDIPKDGKVEKFHRDDSDRINKASALGVAKTFRRLFPQMPYFAEKYFVYDPYEFAYVDTLYLISLYLRDYNPVFSTDTKKYFDMLFVSSLRIELVLLFEYERSFQRNRFYLRLPQEFLEQFWNVRCVNLPY